VRDELVGGLRRESGFSFHVCCLRGEVLESLHHRALHGACSPTRHFHSTPNLLRSLRF
jgi:hypothetical protein